MNRSQRTRLALHGLLCTALSAAPLAACASYDMQSQGNDDQELRVSNAAPFDQAQLDGAKRAGVDKELDIFLRSPMTTGGIPMIIFRILPDLAPEIWGNTVEEIPSVGLFRDPANTAAPLPLGLGYASATPSPERLRANLRSRSSISPVRPVTPDKLNCQMANEQPS